MFKGFEMILRMNYDFHLKNVGGVKFDLPIIPQIYGQNSRKHGLPLIIIWLLTALIEHLKNDQRVSACTEQILS